MLPAMFLSALLPGLGDAARGAAPALVKVDVQPGGRVQHAPARWQQLAVEAHFDNGSKRDVTRLSVFSSSDPAVAVISSTGLVEFKQVGEVAILVRYLENLQSINLAYLEDRPGFVWPNPAEHNFIDKLVFAKLKTLSIAPSDLCTDEEFIRRAYLDLCAILPEPAEVRSFLADTDADKRAKLIDRLLERPEYADFWTLKWMDVLRASRKTLHTGLDVYHSWLRDHVQKNTRFDDVVRQLLTATGNTFSDGPANYFRATRTPEDLAETTGQIFLGVRIGCAKCHNHPFERWTQDDYYSLAAFFARVSRKADSGKKGGPKNPVAEVISSMPSGEVKHMRTGEPARPRFLGGPAPTLVRDADRREALAAWLTAADNPFFARALVNRLWYHLMGRGIVDPPDDFRDSNPPAHPELLDAMAGDFARHGFDVKHLLRTMCNSRVYQLSTRSSDWNKDDRKYFSRAYPRLLTAEQMLDAICQATGSAERFPGKPRGTRAVQIVDGEFEHLFLKSFGQPARDLACECERVGDATLGAALQMVNGATMQRHLSEPKNRLGMLLAKDADERTIIDELYLATLSRLPKEKEIETILRDLRTADDRRRAWEDIHWALLNTREFMFRH